MMHISITCFAFVRRTACRRRRWRCSPNAVGSQELVLNGAGIRAAHLRVYVGSLYVPARAAISPHRPRARAGSR
jgi:hypothetical protein